MKFGQGLLALPEFVLNPKLPKIEWLFIDIGGVLLSDGWGHLFRQKAASEFNIDYDEMEVRHKQAFEAYEIDKLSLAEYLKLVVFYEPRSFTPNQFGAFMFGLSTPWLDMIDLIKVVKQSNALKILVVSNEARALNAYRIKKFGLTSFVDVFLSSSFVRLRKPDPEFFRVALDLVQCPPSSVLYLENTPMFVEVAETFGINSLLHVDISSTRRKLSSFGLNTESSVPAELMLEARI